MQRSSKYIHIYRKTETNNNHYLYLHGCNMQIKLTPCTHFSDTIILRNQLQRYIDIKKLNAIEVLKLLCSLRYILTLTFILRSCIQWLISMAFTSYQSLPSPAILMLRNLHVTSLLFSVYKHGICCQKIWGRFSDQHLMASKKQL